MAYYFQKSLNILHSVIKGKCDDWKIIFSIWVVVWLYSHIRIITDKNIFAQEIKMLTKLCYLKHGNSICVFCCFPLF